jgi:hypothetical protein
MGKARTSKTQHKAPTARVRYGSRTTVSAAQSRAEIEELLTRHGARDFGYRTADGAAVISFRIGEDVCEYRLPLPGESEFYYYADNRKRPAKDVVALHEQATRARWRAAVLVVRARLEAAACGIESFSDAFRPRALLPMHATAEVDMGVLAPELSSKPVAVKSPRALRNRTTLVARPAGSKPLDAFVQ